MLFLLEESTHVRVISMKLAGSFVIMSVVVHKHSEQPITYHVVLRRMIYFGRVVEDKNESV